MVSHRTPGQPPDISGKADTSDSRPDTSDKADRIKADGRGRHLSSVDQCMMIEGNVMLRAVLDLR